MHGSMNVKKRYTGNTVKMRYSATVCNRSLYYYILGDALNRNNFES